MRLRSFRSIAMVICMLLVASHCSRVLSQDGAALSSIRLVSATEPVVEDSAPQPGEQTAPPESWNVNEGSDSATPVARSEISSDPPPAPEDFRLPVASPPANRHWSPVGVYGGPSAQATLNKMPRPAPVQPAPHVQQRSRPRGKPFQSYQPDPTISPYLNLNRSDASATNLPNYFTLVRPQLEQLEANRVQAAEIQKLRGQLQNMSTTAAGPQQSAGMSTSARYMDTAQFYRGMRR